MLVVFYLGCAAKLNDNHSPMSEKRRSGKKTTSKWLLCHLIALFTSFPVTVVYVSVAAMPIVACVVLLIAVALKYYAIRRRGKHCVL